MSSKLCNLIAYLSLLEFIVIVFLCVCMSVQYAVLSIINIHVHCTYIQNGCGYMKYEEEINCLFLILLRCN